MGLSEDKANSINETNTAPSDDDEAAPAGATMAPQSDQATTTTRSQDGKSFSIGSILGVPIQVHYSYFVLVFLAVFASSRYRSVTYSLYEFLIMGPILFVTILIHEFGHVLTARRLGGTAVGIVMWPLGGLAISSRPDPATHRSSMLVAFAGPATHVPQMGFWYVLAVLCALASPNPYPSYWKLDYAYVAYGNAADFFAMVGLGAFYLNATLLCFNLFLPAYPLDGGQIFASFLLMRGIKAERAGLITACTAFGIASLLLVWGIVSFFVGQNPFTLLNILVALWIIHSSFELYNSVKDGRIKDHPLFNAVAEEHSQPVEVA